MKKKQVSNGCGVWMDVTAADAASYIVTAFCVGMLAGLLADVVTHVVLPYFNK